MLHVRLSKVNYVGMKITNVAKSFRGEDSNSGGSFVSSRSI